MPTLPTADGGRVLITLSGVPAPLALALGPLLIIAGLAVGIVAALGARSRLPRNRWAGVRTPATLRSAESFEVGNRVAAPLHGVAGLVAIASGGLLLLAAPNAVLAWIAVAVGVVWPLVLAGIGGMLGDRAARAVAESTPSICGGSCLGCAALPDCARTAGEQAAASPQQGAQQ